MKIFGIDVIKGSVRSRTQRPLFALIRMEDGEIISESEVSLYRLHRLLVAEEPDILAVDSLQEISVDQHGLFTFIQALPPSTRLVQVTGGERTESLGKVAARFNIQFNRFDPYAEARTIARVASLGGGAVVIAFENSCDIVVSRHRSIGKGGWSQNRYIRKIHGAVQQKGREIEDALREAGLKFEKKESKAFGGLSRLHFHVFSPRDMVPVRTYRGPDVQVRIDGRRLDRVRFKPLHGTPRSLIVGIDPGTTIGIAAVDLDGNLVHLISSRQMTMSDVIEELFRLGKPLIIASDVRQMPYSVEKIRRSFNAVPYSPKQDRSVEEKWEITKGYAYNNDHERDALSAALDAYRHYKNKFQNVAKRVPPGYDLDDVRAGVVRGKSIEQILQSMAKGAVSEVSEEIEREEPAPRDERVIQLEGTVKRLRMYVGELQEDIQEREDEITRLKNLMKKERKQADKELRKEQVVVKKDAIIKSLKKRLRNEEKKTKRLNKRIERLKRFADLQMNSEHMPVKVLESLTRDGVRLLDDDLGIGEGDILFVQKTGGWGKSVVDALCSAGIKVIIVGEPSDNSLNDALRRCAIPLIEARMIDIRIRGKIGSVARSSLDDAMNMWKREQHAYERDEKAKMLESIYKEYVSEREKEVRRHG